MNMYERHRRTVADIADRVALFYKQKKPFRIYHGSTNTTRIVEFDRQKMIDTSDLNHVLNIDIKQKTALIEPNVPMDMLVEATLKHGLIPPVVMEFPGITVGGGLQGGAGESSSFKWGGFNSTLNWYEMILASGKLIKTSPDQHSDLFWGAAGSYGSMGVVTLAEVQLVPARTYVELEYFPVTSFEQATSTIATLTKQSYDYIDGIIYSADCGVVMAGRLSDTSSASVHTTHRARDEWFYLHAEKLARRATVTTEAIPLKDYLFRYDRGGFWTGKYAFVRLKTPFNRLTRWLLNPSQEFIIQDLALPAKNAVPFLEFIDTIFHIYPLWLCPLSVDTKSSLLFNFNPQQTMAIINVGVWGYYGDRYDEVVAANSRLEHKVYELGGRKWLYANCYYTEQQFWNIYDKKWYEALRNKYYATSLPTVYEKTRSNKRYAVSAKRGVLHALRGGKSVRFR
jgi:delta24-sterol reductase